MYGDLVKLIMDYNSEVAPKGNGACEKAASREEAFKDKKKLEDGIREKIAEIEASLTPEEKKLYDEYKVRPAYTEKMEELQKLAQKYGLEIEQVDDVIGFKHNVNLFQKSIQLSEEYDLKRTNDAILTLCKDRSLKAVPLNP